MGSPSNEGKVRLEVDKTVFWFAAYSKQKYSEFNT